MPQICEPLKVSPRKCVYIVPQEVMVGCRIQKPGSELVLIRSPFCMTESEEMVMEWKDVTDAWGEASGGFIFLVWRIPFEFLPDKFLIEKVCMASTIN